MDLITTTARVARATFGTAYGRRPRGRARDGRGRTRRLRLRHLVPALALTTVAIGPTGCDEAAGTRYVDRVFDGTVATTDLVYRTTVDTHGQVVELRLDIHRPAGDTATDRPAVMWMFGGGWQEGNRAMMTDYAVDSARRGYVGVTIDYRIRAEGGPVLDMAGDAYEDALAAVRWLRDHAATYGIAPDAVVAGGYSAGAANALNLLYWPGERGPVTASPVAGGVAIAGASFGVPDADDPAALIHHGDTDRVVPFAIGWSTCAFVLVAGPGCTFEAYSGADHTVVDTHARTIQDSTARWTFEQILRPLGFRADRAR